MNIRRFKDQNIPTSVNALDRINIPLSESLTREGILNNYELEYPLQYPSHYVISLILNMIGRILMNNPTPLLTIKS